MNTVADVQHVALEHQRVMIEKAAWKRMVFQEASGTVQMSVTIAVLSETTEIFFLV